MAISRKLKISLLLAIDTVFFFIELISGYMIDSLALIADSFHMLNDIVSLIIALWATSLAQRRDHKPKYTYGWQRAEILGALVNGVFLVALCLSIFLEAIQRFITPPEVTNPMLMLTVGILGFISNIVGIVLFHDHAVGHHDHADSSFPEDDIESVLPATVVNRCRRLSVTSADLEGANLSSDQPSESSPLLSYVSNDHSSHKHIHYQGTSQEPTSSISSETSSTKKKHNHNLNMRGVFLHVMGDALGNFGVISAAIVIRYTNWSWRYYFDPMVSIVLTGIILASAIPLCKSAALILLQVAPHSIRIEDLHRQITALPGVESLHELHIWQLSDVKLIATLHVCVNLSEDNGEAYMKLTTDIRNVLHMYGIHDCTIQPEFTNVASRKPSLNKVPADEACLVTQFSDCRGEECIDHQ